MTVLESLFVFECLIHWILNLEVFSLHSKLQRLLKLPTNCVLFTILAATFVVLWNINFHYSLLFFFPRKALLKKRQRLNFFKLLSSLNSKEKEKKKLLSTDKKKYSYKRAFKNKVSVKFMVTIILNFFLSHLFIYKYWSYGEEKHWECINVFLCLQFRTKFLGTLTMKESTHNFPKFLYMAFFHCGKSQVYFMRD